MQRNHIRSLCILGVLAFACSDDASNDDASNDESSSSESTGDTQATTQGTTLSTSASTDDSSSSSGSSGTPDDSSSSGNVDDSSSSSTDPDGSSSESSSEAGSSDSSSSSGTPGEESSSSTDPSASESSSSGGDEGDTIYEIQDGTFVVGDEVNVDGVIVTALRSNAIFVQEPGGGEYSGVHVFLAGPPEVAVGDEVDINGNVAEFGELTEINAADGSVTATGVTGLDLAATVLEPGELGEPWEAVLVRIEGAPLPVVELPQGDEFVVDAGGTDVRIDDFISSVYDAPATFPDFGIDATFTAVQGPVNDNGGLYKIAPRDADDLEGYVAPEPTEFEVDALLPGDLVITEVMANPTCANDDCEWFEVYNATDAAVDLQGLIIWDDASNEGVVATSLVIGAGEYAVIAATDVTTWPYAFAAGAYFGGDPALGNGGDLVAILNATDILDDIAPWVDAEAGRTWRLDPLTLDADANDNVANWCFSDTPLVDANVIGEYGTPLAANQAACFVEP
ncbi:MAG: lamin tail domain-containing protein [Deltaproteobacteria bacterium]|nr:lamin tail domain-containing protein [Nannocystaceae bacterium]